MKRIVLVALAMLPARALAWGPEGHQIVAILAERHLTPGAAAAVKDLLGGQRMADVAVWADDIKLQLRPETRPWHYVAIPDASPAFDDQRDCAGRNCVVDKIVDFEAVLKDPRASRLQRTEALKFLVHYVGDLHQPLHCEEHGDRGGHLIPVHYPRLENADFHVVWDTGVVETDMAGRDVSAHAAFLDQQLEGQEATLSAGSPEEWANDAHRLAQKLYADLGNPRPPKLLELSDAYGRKYSALTEGQLERAGLRLAAIVNRALGNGL